MAENTIPMQHATKASASFTYGNKSFDSDEDGIVNVPATLTGEAKSHGFEALAAKPASKPLAKDAGGAKGGDKKPGGKPSDVKTGEAEDAGGAKGGDGK
jgi:hypothetical protein